MGSRSLGEINRLETALGAPTGIPIESPNGARDNPDWYINFEIDIDQLRHNLRNEYFDPTDQDNPWKMADGAEPIMNESGINLFIGFLRSTGFSKNILLTNFPQYNDAVEMSRYICLRANYWLHLHAALGDVEIKKESISYVNSCVLPIVKAACLRSLGGGERGRIIQTQRITMQGVMGDGGMMSPQAPQRGIMDTLGGLLGGGRPPPQQY